MRSILRNTLLLAAVLVLPGQLLGQNAGTPPNKVKPTEIEPCCSVVAVSARDSLVTARETASGYTFKFRVTDQTLLSTIKVGDKVWADLTAKKVRLRKADVEPCCSIINARPGRGTGGAL